MRRKFILVGLLLAVFVLPYVLTIEESDAAGEVVEDPTISNECPVSANSAARIVCLSNKLKQSNERFKRLRERYQEKKADLTVCQEDLHTVGPEHEGECFEETHADDEHHARPVGVPGLGSPVRNEQPLTKIFANVQNIYFLLDDALREGFVAYNTARPIKANLEAIKACTTALKSNNGC